MLFHVIGKGTTHFFTNMLASLIFIVLGSWSLVSAEEAVNEDCWNVCFLYAGFINQTSSGRPCQRWEHQYPHQHTFTNNSLYPGEGLKGAENFCRDPTGGYFKPWCYTLDPNRSWEYCTIPLCNSTKTTKSIKCSMNFCSTDVSQCEHIDPCIQNPLQPSCKTSSDPSFWFALGLTIGTTALFSIIGAAWLIGLRMADRRDKQARLEAETEEQVTTKHHSKQTVEAISGKDVSDETQIGKDDSSQVPGYVEVIGEFSERKMPPLK